LGEISNVKSVEKALLNFSQDLALRIKQDYLILTLCPKINPPKNTNTILRALKSVYDMHFFVLLHDYSGTRKISKLEIQFLKEFGKVQILAHHHEKEKRSEIFGKFIRETL
jgi:hypothetical protein